MVGSVLNCVVRCGMLVVMDCGVVVVGVGVDVGGVVFFVVLCVVVGGLEVGDGRLVGVVFGMGLLNSDVCCGVWEVLWVVMCDVCLLCV